MKRKCECRIINCDCTYWQKIKKEQQIIRFTKQLAKAKLLNNKSAILNYENKLTDLKNDE